MVLACDSLFEQAFAYLTKEYTTFGAKMAAVTPEGFAGCLTPAALPGCFAEFTADDGGWAFALALRRVKDKPR